MAYDPLSFYETRSLNKARDNQRTREFHAQRRYGISYAEYVEAKESTGGYCYICRARPERHRLTLDHCHRTNKIRKPLCIKCNTRVGAIEKVNRVSPFTFDVAPYIKYLQEMNQ